jgi:HK97 family phage prohead protease
MMNLRTSPRSNNVERRASPSTVQADLTDDRLIRGFPIVFNVLSEDLGGFRERILPEAVNRSLKADVMALVDHDTAKVIGRTKAGTLSLRKEKKGLHSTIEPDMEISYARDIVRAVARGDVSGMSFGFEVLEDDWHKENGETVRDVIDMRVMEISIVTFPAYLATDVGVAQRSLHQFQQTLGVPSYNWRRLFHEMQADD